MTDKENLNVDLDDILKEFGDMPPEEKLAQADEMEDTIPLDDLLESLGEQESGDTIAFTPVEADADKLLDALIEETKAFGDVSEDTKNLTEDLSLEETIALAEEVPPEPIKLQTPFKVMRRKIVEGPERQYYALREQGVGKLQTVLLLSLLVAVASIAASVFYGMGRLPEDRLRLMIFGQLLLMLISAFLGAFQLVDGLFLLFRLRFRPNTLLFFTFIACIIDGIVCLQSLRVPCCSVFCVQMVMSLWGTCMYRKTNLCRTDTMRSAKGLSGIGLKKDYFGGTKGLVRCEGDVDDFMAFYGKDGAPEKILGIYCLAAFGVALAVGIILCAMKGVNLGIQVFAAAMMTAMPATMLITLERPARLLERKFYKLGVVLCGWQGIKGLSGKASFSISHEDLFPEGTVKLNGVKFYGDLEPATVVSYAATVVERENGTLAPVFNQLRISYNGDSYPLESFKSYAGGIGGGVEGAVVLVGTLPMLKALNVEIPADVRLAGGIGVAVDGVFSCLVAVNYERTRPVAHGIRVLCGYSGLKPVLISDDLVLSGTFLKKKFGIRPKKLLRPEPEEREKLRGMQVNATDRVLALLVRPTLAAYGYTMAGARALHISIILGVAIHILGGVLGLGAVAVLGFIGETALLSPVNLLLYQAVWLIPGILITEWTRAI